MTQYRIINEKALLEPALQTLMEALPQWRREEAMRFRHETGQRECATSYLLLCEMLRDYCGIEHQPAFVKGAHGKPELAFEDNGASVTAKESLPQFSLSHCKRAVAVAVSDEGSVGIDVECLGRYSNRLAEYCMSEAELNRIAEAEDSDEAFTLLWTQKEALLKLTGEGITDDMKTCLTSDRMQGVSIESGCDKAGGYAWSVAFYK